MAKLEPLALVGPTASGKTALALALAAHFPIEIISVDSALVYRGLDIGSAKPSTAEQAQVPHHLIDIADPQQVYSAAQFVRDVHQLVPQIQARGRIPLLVGGTMLYILALREGLSDLPASEASIRKAIQAEALREGWPALHARLQQIDPAAAQRLAPNDAQRIGRALEVYQQTGRSLSDFLQTRCQAPRLAPRYPLPLLSLEPTERSWLHQRIAERTRSMLAAGLVDEVQALHGQGLDPDLPALRAVGYRQVLQCLNDQAPWAELEERITIATRQLAKRQLTWLRSMPRTVLAAESPDLLAQAHAWLAHKSARAPDGGTAP